MEPDLPDTEILFSDVCTTGCLLSKSFVDPWYWVNRSISHGIYPIKEKHCNTAMYGIVLYCSIVKNLCDYVRETVRV